MSILVVDDNTLLLSKIVRSLMLAEHRVRSASSISEAREAIAQQPPQVLCLDLQLPDGNGLDLLQELRDSGHTLPVVIISGHHSDENRARAEQLGAAGFLTKPFSLEALHRILDSLLETKPEPGNGGATTDTTAANIEPVSMERLQRAKRGFVTRCVDLSGATQLITEGYAPRPGDLVLGRIDRLRLHGRLELPTGRRSVLFPGDEYIGCYANRYAPDQFEAEIPEDLSACNLVAAGGLTSNCVSRHSGVKPASEVTPLGVLADANGKVLNLTDFALPTRPAPAPASRPTVTAVLGTSMNAGKTTVVADLALGMSRNGLRVGAAKVTGTGAGGDIWRMLDSGCERVLDFTDAGYPTTYKVPLAECEAIMETLVAELCETGVDTIVIEVADGILQPETRALASSPVFQRLVDNVIFAAGDALSAANGAGWLEQQGIEVAAISGAITASPLAVRECSTLTPLPILGRRQLKEGEWMPPGVDLPGAANLQATA